MSIKAVAVILSPNESVPHGTDLAALITDEDGSEEQARHTLVKNFAHTLLGPVLPNLDAVDAWNIWKMAEKNGFRIKVATNLVEILGPRK